MDRVDEAVLALGSLSSAQLKVAAPSRLADLETLARVVLADIEKIKAELNK